MSELFHRPVPKLAWTALRTPTLPPAKYTNCAFFGESRFVIVDAGALQDSERERLVHKVQERQAQGHELFALLLTHHHPDHIGAMAYLRERFGVPIYAHPQCEARVDFEVDHYVREGDSIELSPGENVSVFETPGHAEGHVIYLHEPSRWCYAGDLVIGRGSVLIDERDGGCVVNYLNSLRRVRELCSAQGQEQAAIAALLPGHGQPIEDCVQRIDQLISHRLYREQQLLDLLSARPHNIDEVIASIYKGKPNAILPFARATINSHLRKLAGESRIVSCGPELWELNSPSSCELSC